MKKISEQDSLLTQLDRYWQCFACGRVIDDPNLAKTLETAGGGWGLNILCPKCGSKTSKDKFPGARFRPLFKMMVECSQLERAILVLILAQTAFESMLDGFLYRLLDNMNCPEDIALAVTDQVRGISAKARFVKSLTGKDIEKMIGGVGFRDIVEQFETIRKKRNSFLHTAKQEEDLTQDDVTMALKFACATVDLYAALFSKYREQRPLIEHDEDHPL